MVATGFLFGQLSSLSDAIVLNALTAAANLGGAWLCNRKL